MTTRIDSPYLSDNDVLTRTDGDPDGATPGEMTISAVTTLPTTIGDADFHIAGLFQGKQGAAPRALSIGARITGSTTESAIFRVAFWNPTTSQWYLTSGFTVLASGQLDDSSQALDGNAYFPSCPRWASEGMIHVIQIPAASSLKIAVSKDRA